MFDTNVLTREISAEGVVASTEACAPDYCRKWSFNRIAGITDTTILQVTQHMPYQLSQNISVIWFQQVSQAPQSIGFDRDEVFEALLRRLSEQENVVQLKTLAELSEDAENYLSSNGFLSEIMADLVSAVREEILKTYDSFRAKIFFSYDKEVPGWSDLVFSVRVAEDNMTKRLELYDVLGKVTERLIGKWRARQIKRQNIKRLDEFDHKLSLEVKNITDVQSR